jgi:cbb3-type cytochrome oxidase subunit 3
MLAGIITAILLIVFVVSALWVYSPKRAKEFYQASMLPFEENDSTSVQQEETP